MITFLTIACAPGEEPSAEGDPAASVAARDGALGGRVLDGAGAPIAGASVVATPRGYEAATDPDGFYRFERLLPGSYRLVVAADGFAVAETDPVAIVAGEEATLDVTLGDAVPPAPLLTVTVRGPDELPLVGAVVAAGGQSAKTDAAGVAALALAPGPVDVSVTAGDLWPRTVEAVEMPEDGGLQLALTLSGRAPADAVVVGNGLCVLCHPDKDLPTRHARAAALTATEPLGAFAAGWTLALPDGASVRLEPGPTAVLVDAAAGERSFPVAGWIGDPARAAVPWAEVNGDPVPLPFAWVADDAARLPLAEAAAHLAADSPQIWFTAGVARDPLPSESASARCLPCHVTGAAATFRKDGGVDLATTWPFGPPGRFAEAGVSCEACHGPGSAHISAPVADMPFRITRPDWLDAGQRADLCASCHSAYASDAGVPWSPGFAAGDALTGTSTATFWPSGVADAPGEQADELAASRHGLGAAFPLDCLDCHDPHGDAAAHQLRASAEDNTLCAGCHLGPSFAGDAEVMADHTGHQRVDPGAPTASGRCVGCHQPRTASRTGFGAQTGAGTISSHLFLATPPADAVAAFDDLGVDVLAPGLFPANPCQDCHAVAFAIGGALETGPSGDPSLRETHEALQTYYDEMFP